MFYASEMIVSAAEINMSPVWLILMVLFMIIEAAVPGLVSIWFAIGALAALLSALIGAPIWLQVLWFILVSLLSLWLTRPLVKKYVNSRVQPTNADALIGQDGVVTEAIDNIKSQGAVKICGQVWSARTADEALSVPVDTVVKVLRIEGVKLIVEVK